MTDYIPKCDRYVYVRPRIEPGLLSCANALSHYSLNQYVENDRGELNIGGVILYQSHSCNTFSAPAVVSRLLCLPSILQARYTHQ